MIIKIYYRKNLKLSSQKLSATTCHIGKELGKLYWIHTDIGLTEVESGTEIAIGYIDET